MEQDKLDYFKELFLSLKNDLELKIKSDLDSDEEIDLDGDDIDVASGVTLSKVAKDLSKRRLFQLNRVKSALERISNGTFGDCEECGEPIGHKRLLAKPEAISCITCAELSEHKSKQYIKR
jgi:DnaK suppressor protein